MEVTPHTGGCQGRQSIPACSPAPGAAAEGNQTTAHCCLQQGLCCRLVALSVWETPVLCHSSKRCSKKNSHWGPLQDAARTAASCLGEDVHHQHPPHHLLSPKLSLPIPTLTLPEPPPPPQPSLIKMWQLGQRLYLYPCQGAVLLQKEKEGCRVGWGMPRSRQGTGCLCGNSLKPSHGAAAAARSQSVGGTGGSMGQGSSVGHGHPMHPKCGSTSQAVPLHGGSAPGQSLHLGAAGLAGLPRWWPPGTVSWGAGPAGSCLKWEPGWDGEGEAAIAVSEISGCGTSCRGVGGYGRRLVHC